MSNFSLQLSDQFRAHPQAKKQLVKLLHKGQSELVKDSADQPISIVIRVRNEAATLKALLASIQGQTYTQPIQIIVVDNESTDDSVQIAKQHGATVVTLKKAEFTYPKSMNLGAAQAIHPLLLEMVGHALPAHNYWLRAGVRHFADTKVAGTYGCPVANNRTRWLDGLFRYIELRWYRPYTAKITKTRTSVLGAHNCIIRTVLWQQHPFDERYEAGGEDTAWANWALERGLVIIRDPIFSVHHSHGQKTLGFIKQVRAYTKMKSPQPITKMSNQRKSHFTR